MDYFKTLHTIIMAFSLHTKTIIMEFSLPTKTIMPFSINLVIYSIKLLQRIVSSED